MMPRTASQMKRRPADMAQGYSSRDFPSIGRRPEEYSRPTETFAWEWMKQNDKAASPQPHRVHERKSDATR